MALTTNRKITIALGAGVGLVVAAGALTMASVGRLDESARLVAHTHEVRTELEAVRTRLAQTDAYLRGELLVGGDAARAGLDARMAATTQALSRARALTSDDPEQRDRLALAERILAARQTAVHRAATAATVAEGRAERLDSVLVASQVRSLSDRLAATLDSADVAQRRLLDQRLAVQSARARQTNIVVLVVVLLAGALGLAARRSIARDLARRLAAEEALRGSEAKFAGILAIAADAIITIDEEQRIVHFNRGAEEIFGYAAAEMMGQPLEPLIPLAARAGHREQVARFGRSPETSRRMGARREVSGRRKSGEEFPAEASISKLESGGRMLYTVVLRDVSDRKRAEDRQRFLAQAGAALAASLDYGTTLDVVARLALPILGDACVVDIDGRAGRAEVAVAHVDPAKGAALREMRRRYPIPMDGPHPLAVVRRTGTPLVVPAIDDALLARTALGEAHARAVRELGLRSAMFVPLATRDSVIGVLSYYTDGARVYTDDDLALAGEVASRAALAIDNARLYEESRRASAARDEVLAVVSHDLRNPLSTINMCAGAILDPDPISRDGMLSMAETIHLSADWAQRIIRDLLDVTSIEAGRLALDRSPLPVSVALESARGVMQMQAEGAGIELVVREEGTLPRVDADPERVLQVLLNLLGNALKFTPAGGTVTLRAGPELDAAGEPSFVRFSVADTGPGIAPGHLPHLFDRYWQVRSTGRAGAGLGLAIAKGIVEAHGGTIEVTSALGVGTTFSFTIPVAGVAAGPAPSPPHHPADRAWPSSPESSAKRT